MDSKGALQNFIIQRSCSLPPRNGLMYLGCYCFHPKVRLGPSIEEASAGSYNEYIIALLRSGSIWEYSLFRFCMGPPYSQANTASLESNILLYCLPTHTIIYMYCTSSRHDWMGGVDWLLRLLTLYTHENDAMRKLSMAYQQVSTTRALFRNRAEVTCSCLWLAH